MVLFLYVKFHDATYRIPARVLAVERAKYYAALDAQDGDGVYEDLYDEELKYTLENEDEIIDWASNNTDWADVSAHAERVSPVSEPDYADEWTNAPKSVREG